VEDSQQDVERLRARVAELEAQLATQQAAPTPAAPPPPRSRREGQWWRTVVVAVLITVGAVLAPLTVVATWAHDEVGDTDRFVDTVAPLASDPAVQDALATRVTDEIVTAIDVEGITGEALTALSDQRFVPPRAADVLPSLAVPLSNAIESFVQTRVERLVRSDAFEQAWVEAVREAHTAMVAVLTGETGESVDVSDGAVRVNIATFVAAVKEILLDEGFNFANRIPDVNATFTIFQSDDLGTAQKIFAWLDTAARILPILTLIVLFTAVMVARDRRMALLVASLAVVASMVLLGIVLNLLRPVYLDAVPSDVLPADAAAAVYDQLVSFIRTSLRAVGVVFLAVAVAAFWFSPSGAGAALRSGSGAGLQRLRSRTGMDTGPVGDFLATYRTFVRVTLVGIGAIVYVGIDHPTAGQALTIIVVVLLALIVLELLAAPSRRADLSAPVV
jgi:hypothetical protein